MRAQGGRKKKESEGLICGGWNLPWLAETWWPWEPVTGVQLLLIELASMTATHRQWGLAVWTEKCHNPVSKAQLVGLEPWWPLWNFHLYTTDKIFFGGGRRVVWKSYSRDCWEGIPTVSREVVLYSGWVDEDPMRVSLCLPGTEVRL